MPHTPETARPAIADPASVDAAIESRFSARAFLPRPVPQAMLQDILRVASRAPSGTNTQPWKVYVLQGAARDALVDKVCAAHDQLRDNPELEARYPEPYDYYPAKWVEPYLSRRRAVGLDMYGLLGIGKGEKTRCTPSSSAISAFLMRPWACSSPSTASWAGAACWTTAAFCKA